MTKLQFIGLVVGKVGAKRPLSPPRAARIGRVISTAGRNLSLKKIHSKKYLGRKKEQKMERKSKMQI